MKATPDEIRKIARLKLASLRFQLEQLESILDENGVEITKEERKQLERLEHNGMSIGPKTRPQKAHKKAGPGSKSI